MSYPRCGHNHRTTRALAKCLWPRAAWIVGEGEFAVLAHCRALTVSLWADAAAAEESKLFIDRSKCGGLCRGAHEVVHLNTVGDEKVTRWPPPLATSTTATSKVDHRHATSTFEESPGQDHRHHHRHHRHLTGVIGWGRTNGEAAPPSQSAGFGLER